MLELAASFLPPDCRMSSPVHAQLTLWSQQLDSTLLADRHKLRRELQQLREQAKRGAVDEKQLARVGERLLRSVEKVAARAAARPLVSYDDTLPVHARREDIGRAIAQHQVVIICGETGSGKTTQIPKICLELGRGLHGLIGHTQPRRIAARSVATRLAQELNQPLGEAVGFQVRFTENVKPTTAIKLMTDGILLAETQGDAYLNRYDTIIIDEAHERSLNIDFLLGYLKQLLPKRPELKVIVTSATIDADRFSRHFNGAPVIEVSGRTFPVEMRYRPLAEHKDDEDGLEVDLEQAVADAVDELQREGLGDTLVFLPGEREIRDVAEHLRKAQLRGTEILPLFARLSHEEQQRIFKPSSGRRIVLTTNVAETSLTVPGIRYVIDTGLARVKRYSPRSKVEQLQIEPISQAAANQRAGRCGRVMSGVCIRLFSEDDYKGRSPFTDPEILRSSLAGVILRMESLKLGHVDDFPFLEAPGSRQISDGYQLLLELGAVDEQRRLTSIGQELAKLPLDPKIGRMLLAAREQHCLEEMLIVASGLSIQDPRERPFDARDAADRAQQRFLDDKSDFVAFLNLWRFFDEALTGKKSNRQLIELCHEHFLSHVRLREWRDLHGQLKQITDDLGWRLNTVAATHEQLHSALLAGLIAHIGLKSTESDEYLGTRGLKFFLWPGSGLKKARPKWVLAAELTDTGRLYGRRLAAIEPEWVEKVAKPLCSYSYLDPQWDKDSAQVIAFERVMLYGLPIVARRRISYGRINPVEARELFIREALVHKGYESRGAFVRHNAQLMREVQALEHKTRRQDVMVDEEALFDFYNSRIPEGIVSGASFESWRAEAEKKEPKLLYLSREDLMQRTLDEQTVQQYPDRWLVGDEPYKLKYRFEPGHVLDGLTVEVPLHQLNRFDAVPFEWLVPGMRRDKIALLIKSLPKALRRVCVPVPDFVTAFLSAVPAYAEPLLPALATYIEKRSGQKVDASEFDLKDLPAHCFINYRVVDDAGRELASGRNLVELQRQLGQAAQLDFRDTASDFEREGLTQWDFGDLPETLTITRNKKQMTGYPALVDMDDSVALMLLDTADAARSETLAGICRLLRFELKEHLKQLEKTLDRETALQVALRGVMSPEQLTADLVACIVDRAFIGEDALPRSAKGFADQKQRARTRLPAVTQGALRLASDIAQEYQQVQARLNQAQPRLKQDLQNQLKHMIYKDCFSRTPWERLAHLPRYLKAMRLRVDKYAANPARDGQRGADIAQLWNRYVARMELDERRGMETPALQDFRWQIEELRVSLFAQELKTPSPVSGKRLQKFWDDHIGA